MKSATSSPRPLINGCSQNAASQLIGRRCGAIAMRLYSPTS
jgi:hypothetical protein